MPIGHPEVLTFDDPVTFINPADLKELVARARSGAGLRAGVRLRSYSIMQERIVLARSGEYVPPMRIIPPPKSILLLSGSLVLVVFDHAGVMTDHYHLAAESDERGFLVRLNTAVWHMCIPGTTEAVFLETVLGAAREENMTEWVPARDGPGADQFYNEICARCGILNIGASTGR